ncbi:MAG TPA: DNA mismatch repair protein MutS [Halanaerobiaceae bacterium]|nr:DNA mismatch repair protein MutS [Bacillota bacterium]HHU92580.1 DNA mismatch repair protein MutS [Halanaerobiaceae bacterium]HOA41033.1 DNA mismatch repair protein MutS [Halanaerobiales bacterium]HPZ63301.1 DNA mismatch repair protein MutS [Halanaerobiales bacterium]HQD04552.1 DNA mismatch repair protein MutS [Halanaerobiales bacterium]
MSQLTPMMEQYLKIKEKYKDAILFFRLGDFYEMFFEDAKIAARVLDIALTARNKGGGEKAPMAGVPYHSADSYIAKLIEQGFKVAICEQLEDPAEANGLVERDVIRVITPGTIIDSDILQDKENNYLAAIVIFQEMIGFSYIDISTGEFYVTELSLNNFDKLWDELDRIQPRELIRDDLLLNKKDFQYFCERNKVLLNELKGINLKGAEELLLDHFQINSLSIYGLEESPAALIAAGEVLSFVQETQKKTLKHINRLSFYNLNDYMLLDTATRRNLELTTSIQDNRKKGSLLAVLDKTLTSMGGRLLKKWINQPLIKKDLIEERLNAIEELKGNFLLLQAIRNNIDGIYDLERILSRITYGSANARDLTALSYSLEKLPALKNNLLLLSADFFSRLNRDFDTLEDIADLLAKAIVDEPPVSIREGGLIRDGYNEELDRLRAIMRNGRQWISNLQASERERTGINSLKVGYNKVFGYYIEVTRANLDKVPEDYTRKQTLANSERYITPALKEMENQILSAEERVNDLEYELFLEIRAFIEKNIERIRKIANIVALIDVISSLTLAAVENNYTKPLISEEIVIEIKEGRHPVVEKVVKEKFVPNDTYLDQDYHRFLIITGPNMSGKSTYMRQVALIVLMAQIGSFVPASFAKIGLVDRIFTRIGASDSLSTGQSTFMVEMNEVANILNNASSRSLIILDEVGRGTSTYDGLSIAWAVSEYINNPGKIGARSLFATHYHELTRLEESFAGIKNFNVLVEESEAGIHFLHKIVPGKANESYGIEVAKLAGLPEEVIDKANGILKELESNNKELLIAEEGNQDLDKQNQKKDNSRGQMALFEERKNRRQEEILEKLINKNLFNLTPIEAMNFLYQLQEEARKGIR